MFPSKDNRFKLCLIAMLLVLAGSLLFFDRLMVLGFAVAHNLSISYDDLKRGGRGTLVFERLSVIDRGSGLGLVSDKASVKWESGILFKDAALSFSLSNGRFIRTKSREAARDEGLSGLVAMPFGGNLPYREISGAIELRGRYVGIKRLFATSDDIMINLDGRVYRNGDLALNIAIDFSDRIVSGMPPEVTDPVLTEKGTGWKGFAVSLSGNYQKPTIQVSGRLFRLNIGPAR